MGDKWQRHLFGNDPKAVAIVAADRLLAMSFKRGNSW
jgi:hypothetical protein